MRKHHSLLHADRILAKVRKQLGRDFGGDRVTISCWSNGREQGYFIDTFPNPEGKCEPMALCFAECRGSDQAMVVVGRTREFDHQTHQPSNDLWEKKGARRYFDEDDEAADFIRWAILNALEPVAAAMMKEKV